MIMPTKRNSKPLGYTPIETATNLSEINQQIEQNVEASTSFESNESISQEEIGNIKTSSDTILVSLDNRIYSKGSSFFLI